MDRRFINSNYSAHNMKIIRALTALTADEDLAASVPKKIHTDDRNRDLLAVGFGGCPHSSAFSAYFAIGDQPNVLLGWSEEQENLNWAAMDEKDVIKYLPEWIIVWDDENDLVNKLRLAMRGELPIEMQ